MRGNGLIGMWTAKGASHTAPISPTAEQLANELAERWAAIFAAKSWNERLELLNQVHEQLQEDLADLDLYSAVSPLFISKLIDRLEETPVTSLAQAHIYANSQKEEHRRVAGEWLAQHGAAPPRED